MIENNFNGLIIEGTVDLFIIHIQFTKKKKKKTLSDTDPIINHIL